VDEIGADEPVWARVPRADVAAELWSEPDVFQGWGHWLLRWYAAIVLVVGVGVGVYGAIEAGNPLQVAWPLVFLPLIGAFLGPTALLAWGLRWLWYRLAPRPWRTGSAAAVLLGALATILSVVVLATISSPERWLVETRSALDLVLAPAVALGGAVAGLLAERQVSARNGQWWLTVALTGLGIGVWLWFADAL
jgi:hypothetical protein